MTLPKMPCLCRLLIALLLTTTLRPAVSEEQALGRLFFTPERRQALDRQRLMNIQDTQQVNEESTLTIDGVVTRGDGKRTVWINGVPHTETDAGNGLSLTSRGRATGKFLVQQKSAPPANVRVGETLDRNSGQTHSPLNKGRIVPGRRAE